MPTSETIRLTTTIRAGEVALIDNLIGMGVNVAIGGAIRVATGGSFWDAKGIAIDAGIGFVTSGLAALNALRRGAEISEKIYVAGVGCAQRTRIVA